jgi:hypothetical protein
MVVSEERLGKHLNDIPGIARQRPIAIIEECWGAVFSVWSARRLYNEDPRSADGN